MAGCPGFLGDGGGGGGGGGGDRVGGGGGDLTSGAAGRAGGGGDGMTSTGVAARDTAACTPLASRLLCTVAIVTVSPTASANAGSGMELGGTTRKDTAAAMEGACPTDTESAGMP